ncbi:MAG: HlyD family type I secretion periplasmic adaptor subunit [Hyphomicrobiaceae bacterium]|nr:HlyD family type I secretion periplasmic adaptor subunit [Hyphomicrobiaceae bacterium]
MTSTPQSPPLRAPVPTVRRATFAPYIAGAFAVVAVLFGGVGVWAVTTDIAGAVLAGATVVVDSSVKKVQHPTGGVVGEIHVRNGDRVSAGDLLIRLDETMTRANLQIITKQLDEFVVREARLAAERGNAPAIDIPEEIRARMGETAIKETVRGEISLFNSRRSSLESETSQLRERIRQLREESDGLDSQREAKATEITLIDKELESLADLELQRLVTTSKMMSLRREAARLRGEHARLLSAAAQTRGKITEIEISVVQREQEFRTEVVKELRDVQTRIAELGERKIAALDQLQRVDIRAPTDGIVHELSINTVGGVISPSEPLMLIVPNDDRLVIEAMIDPRDREQVRIGAPAVIRFAAFNMRTTPEVMGEVTRISADLAEDKRTGSTFYLVRLSIGEAELAKLGDNRLVPGLPADVQITTNERTALSYLVKPLQDQLAKAFRER